MRPFAWLRRKRCEKAFGSGIRTYIFDEHDEMHLHSYLHISFGVSRLYSLLPCVLTKLCSTRADYFLISHVKVLDWEGLAPHGWPSRSGLKSALHPPA